MWLLGCGKDFRQVRLHFFTNHDQIYARLIGAESSVSFRALRQVRWSIRLIQNHTRANKSAPLHTFKREQDMIQTAEPVLATIATGSSSCFAEIADKEIRGDRHKPATNAFHDHGIESLDRLRKTVRILLNRFLTCSIWAATDGATGDCSQTGFNSSIEIPSALAASDRRASSRSPQQIGFIPTARNSAGA